MTGEISIVSGMTTEARFSPVMASSTRAGSATAPKTPAQPPAGYPESTPNGAEENAFLTEQVERARETMKMHNAIFSFKRDAEDGRMYLHVIDKTTGEEIYCIPKNYLKNLPQHWQSHELDVHV